MGARNSSSRSSVGAVQGIEVAVFATRKFKKGEEINLCRGGVADLTEEEDNKLRQGGQKADFSVLYSSRKKSFGLLLGPARFVNVSTSVGDSTFVGRSCVAGVGTAAADQTLWSKVNFDLFYMRAA